MSPYVFAIWVFDRRDIDTEWRNREYSLNFINTNTAKNNIWRIYIVVHRLESQVILKSLGSRKPKGLIDRIVEFGLRHSFLMFQYHTLYESGQRNGRPLCALNNISTL
jgi:hypothetical protein